MNTGDTVEGRYQIERLLGQGGDGKVFQAHDLELDKRVAIKTLLPQSLADRRSIAQLKSEVRLAQDLRDENICGVYHFHISDSEPFIVMEFIDGEKLSDFIFRQPGHSCGEVTFRRVAAQILKAVEYAHGAGVIHRGLKTSNIMIRRDESVRVLDFGIAASLKDAHSRATGGEVALSIHYASPEQIRGERPSVAMDIYSLGCVFHEMLTGRPPFRQGDVLQRHLTEQPAPMPGVSRMLNRAVLACLAKDAKAQPQSAEDLAAWILEPEDLTVKTVRRGGNRAIWWAAGLLALASAAFAVYEWPASKRPVVGTAESSPGAFPAQPPVQPTPLPHPEVIQTPVVVPAPQKLEKRRREKPQEAKKQVTLPAVKRPRQQPDRPSQNAQLAAQQALQEQAEQRLRAKQFVDQGNALAARYDWPGAMAAYAKAKNLDQANQSARQGYETAAKRRRVECSLAHTCPGEP